MVGGGSVHFLALPSAPEVARADNERDFHAKIVNGFDFFDNRRNYVLVETVPLFAGKRLARKLYQYSFIFRRHQNISLILLI